MLINTLDVTIWFTIKMYEQWLEFFVDILDSKGEMEHSERKLLNVHMVKIQWLFLDPCRFYINELPLIVYFLLPKMLKKYKDY